MGAEEIFDKCKEVLADREGNYGDARPMFGAIARMWTAFLNVLFPDYPDIVISESDAAVMLVLFKIARAKGRGGKFSDDTGVDVVNYSALWADLEGRDVEEIKQDIETMAKDNDEIARFIAQLKEQPVWDKDRFENP